MDQIEPTARHSRKRLDHGDIDMVIYRHSDFEVLDPEAEKCGVDHDHHGKTGDSLYGDLLRQAGSVDPTNKRVSSGCPTSMKVLYMVSDFLIILLLLSSSC